MEWEIDLLNYPPRILDISGSLTIELSSVKDWWELSRSAGLMILL
jgi:hypothetical protein